MQISSSAFLAVECLVRLAAYNAEKPCTALSLAEGINRSISHTETLLSRLRVAGLVKARKGPGGGHYLARPAHRITVTSIRADEGG